MAALQMVGMRACYLFSRLVKGLRQNLLPLLPDLLLRLQPHLAHIVSTPLPETPPTKSAQGAHALCQQSFALSYQIDESLS